MPPEASPRPQAEEFDKFLFIKQVTLPSGAGGDEYFRTAHAIAAAIPPIPSGEGQ